MALAGVIAGAEEAFLIPVYAGENPERWVALHRLLTRPLLRLDEVREWRATVDGHAVNVAACGRPKRFRWLFTRLFGDLGPGQLGPRVRTTDPRCFSEITSDFLAVEVHADAAAAYRANGWIVVPELVLWGADVFDPWLAASGHAGRGLRSDLTLIAGAGYRAEEGGSSADWICFREEMLFPYVRQRFGSEAWLPSRGFLRALRARGRLLFAVRDGRRVSAICFVQRGRHVWAPVLGVLGGDAELVRQGAIAALYKHLLDWSREHGVETIDMGRTRASVADGAAWFKHKWGFRPRPDPLAHLVALRIGPGAAPVRERLAALRILVQCGDGLHLLEAGPGDGAHASWGVAVSPAPEP
jgi:hypothetical protein